MNILYVPKTFLRLFAFFAVFLVLPTATHAATRTISDTGGNWNSASSWVEAAVPTSADDVVATATSGNVAIMSTAYARSVDLSAYTGTLTHASARNLIIGDAVAGTNNNALVLSGAMTYASDPYSIITFVSTSPTAQNIDLAGNTAGHITFNGNGGSWQLASDLLLSNASILSLTQGSLDANNFAVETGRFYAPGTASRALSMGSGTWNINGHNSGAGKVWATGGLSTLTVDPGTATVNFTYSGSEGNRGIQTSCHPDVHWPDFNITGGSDGLFITNMCNVKNVDFTGFSGTMLPDQWWSGPPHSFIMLEGNLTLSPSISFAPDFTLFYMHFIGPEAKTLTTNGLGTFPGNLKVSGGSVTLVDDLSITDDFMINTSNATVNGNGRAISVGGDWINNDGTFNAQNSTVSLTGANQNVIGSTTFFNLFKEVTAADTLTFDAGSTQVTTGELLLGGAAGELLTLVSSSPGTQWIINPTPGKSSLNYLDVQDSYNDGPSVVKAKNSVDSGNNHRWVF